LVKIIAVIAIATGCFAGPAADAAIKIVGSADSKIEKLFSRDGDYIDINGNIDISKVSETLKINSLLRLNYQGDVKFSLRFKSSNAPLLLVKIVKDTLNRLGYNDISVTDFLNGDEILFGVSVNSKFVLDPGSFYTALKQIDTTIKDVRRLDEFSYFYELDLSKTAVSNVKITSGENTLSKPLEPYLIDVSGAKVAAIGADGEDRWSAIVRILDKNLNLLEEKRSDKAINSLKVSFPQNAKYLMIDDAVSLENIKRGLKIYLE